MIDTFSRTFQIKVSYERKLQNNCKPVTFTGVSINLRNLQEIDRIHLSLNFYLKIQDLFGSVFINYT